MEGKGEFYIEDKQFEASEGDIVIIEVGRKSYVQAENLKMLTITQPNWYEDQCQLVESEV